MESGNNLMNAKKRPVGRSGSKVGKNKFVTKSGKVIKVPRTLTQRWINARDAKEARRAKRLIGLPKGRFKRIVFHLHPKRVFSYWFSYDGIIMGLKLLGLALAVGFLITVGVFAYFRKDLPNLKDISGNNIGGSVRYYDRSGTVLLWEDYDAVKRIPVQDANISHFMKNATVAVEDKDFFHHGGFDTRGIIRAGVNDFIGHGSKQGGSTITQQLVKLTQDWSADRTYSRKIKEVILSVELERSYTKQEILTGYLNTAPYGGIEYGVEAASQGYFQKSAKDLTLAEAAMLATIPKSPRYYSPYSSDFDKPAFIGREQYILDIMQQQGMITKVQRDAAKKVDVIAEVKPRQNKFANIKAPWFVLAAKKQLEDTKGEDTVKRGGWTVVTTLDNNLQNIAEQQVSAGLAQVRRQGGDVAAFAAEDVHTGQMVALVGGSDFSNPDYGQINYAKTPLPPGSSFKPYDYTAFIENGTNIGAGSVLYDSQGAIDGYPCTNKQRPKQGGNCLWDYDFNYPGPITLRYALGGSRNVPAVKAMLTTGIDKTIQTANKMMDPSNGSTESGYNCYYDEALSKKGPCYASSAIGDGAYLHLDEHVHGLATISRNGLNIPQTYILKITDASGKVIDQWKPSKGTQVVRQDSAYIVADMMSDPNASYFPANRKPQRYTNSQGTWKFSMKTGTTNDGKDGWMVGFSTQYAAGVWVGYHTRRVVMSGTMENMTQPIWQGWMQGVHKDLKPVDREKPADLQTLPAYVIHSHVGIGSVEPSPATDLFPAWYKQTSKTSGAPHNIDVISNKLATDCTPDLAKKSVTDAQANVFSADKFQNPTATGSTTENDDVHLCTDVKPSLDAISIDNSDIVSVTVHQGTHPLSSADHQGTVNFIAGGQVLQTFNVDSDGQAVTYDASGQPAGTVISAQIVDSVLYDNTSPNSVTTTAVSQQLVLNAATGTGTNASFIWTGGTGPFTVTVKRTLPATTTTCNSAGNSCSVSLSTPTAGSYTATVKDSTGTVSNSVAFSR
jgi:membrane peptidoglycan carboxypeptidase